MIAITPAPQDMQTKIDLGRSQIVGSSVHYTPIAEQRKNPDFRRQVHTEAGYTAHQAGAIFKEDPYLVKSLPDFTGAHIPHYGFFSPRKAGHGQGADGKASRYLGTSPFNPWRDQEKREKKNAFLKWHPPCLIMQYCKSKNMFHGLLPARPAGTLLAPRFCKGLMLCLSDGTASECPPSSGKSYHSTTQMPTTLHRIELPKRKPLF